MKILNVLLLNFVCVLSLLAQSYGLRFDGTNDWVDIPNSTSLNPDSTLTIEMWFNTDYELGSIPEDYACIYDSETNNYVFFIRKSDSTLNFQVVNTESDTLTASISGSEISSGEWYHIAGEYKRNQIENFVLIYLNGINKESDVKSSLAGQLNSGQVATLGRNGTSANSYKFYGYLDEVRVWNVKRNQPNIQEYMYKELQGNENGLILYYNMNNGSGQILYDETNNNNNGSGSVGISNSWVVEAPFIIPFSSQPSGSGTEIDPYQIADIENLLWMAEDSSRWDKYYIQTTDIDASETEKWIDNSEDSPVGWPQIDITGPVYGFSGEYDGQSYVISGLFQNQPEGNAGFFGYIEDGSISNLGLENIDIYGSNWNVGGFCGETTDSSSITNCYVTGSIADGTRYRGGFVGDNCGTINQCYSDCLFDNIGDYCGGFVGRNNIGATISNSYSKGTVSTTYSSYIGGFVGYNYGGTISNSYSTGSVSGTSNVGGFAGGNYFGTITHCFWDTQTSDLITSEGGSGRTTYQMKSDSTFTDSSWDFTTVWDMDPAINDGYPYLINNSPEVPLPIELASFSASTDHGTVELHWITASETENSHFLIYRDTKIIALVEGAGTTSESQKYIFTDEQVVPGLHKYALADVSYGGVEILHKCLLVEVGVKSLEMDFVLNRPYPNPFNPEIIIGFCLSSANFVEINIYNTQGHLVDQLLSEHINAGNHEVIWNAETKSSGVYIVMMKTNNVIQTQKLLLMK